MTTTPPAARRRTRQSAKAAGARFERQVADYLAATLDDRIDRRAKTGSKDRGDITGMRHHGQRVVVEIKNAARAELAAWWAEAEIERGNDDAGAALVVHKRHGRAHPAEQWVCLTLGELVALLTGSRGHLGDCPGCGRPNDQHPIGRPSCLAEETAR